MRLSCRVVPVRSIVHGGVCLGLAALLLGTAPPARAEESGGYPGTPVYRKPFLTAGGAAVGGYMDLEFLAGEAGSTFDQHRFVPFIYAEVSDRVHVASEIEFEHGGFVAGDEETDGEIKVEFATVDFRVTNALNLRGGVLLSPLGRLNVYHDAPMLDLTDRPLVDRTVIPTTLSEAGVGVYGSFALSETWLLDYEAYAVNGFAEDAVSDGILTVRDGRGSARADNNNSRSLVGRVGVSPRLGTEVGVSVHTGDYDDAGDHTLTIAALDARFAQGPVEILGEGAMARADVSGVPGVDRAESAGFYLEGHLHVLDGAIAALPQSVFTTAVRLDYVDADRNAVGGDTEQVTLGVNFRPTEETVVKNDFLFSRTRGSGLSDWGDTDTGYRFSIATYF